MWSGDFEQLFFHKFYIINCYLEVVKGNEIMAAYNCILLITIYIEKEQFDNVYLQV